MFGLLGLLNGSVNPIDMLRQSGPFGAALAGTIPGASASSPPTTGDNPQAVVNSPPQPAGPDGGFQTASLGNYQTVTPKQQPVTAGQPDPATSQGMPPPVRQPVGNDNFLARARESIAKIESGGNYGAVGKPTRTGDRAYGKYQVMGNNVGPWTQQYLGTAMTPQQFLKNPQAQDAVFNGRFGMYAQKYGPEGAAHAWYAGEKGMKNMKATDGGPLTVAGYGHNFMKGMGGVGPDPQVASMTSPSSGPSIDASSPTPDNGGIQVANAQAAAPPNPEDPQQTASFMDNLLAHPFHGGQNAQPAQLPQSPPPTDTGAQEVAQTQQTLQQQKVSGGTAQTEAQRVANRKQTLIKRTRYLS